LLLTSSLPPLRFRDKAAGFFSPEPDDAAGAVAAAFDSAEAPRFAGVAGSGIGLTAEAPVFFA
jgi:hypothetical protein